MNIDERVTCTELWDAHKERIHQVCSIKLRSCPSEVEDVVSEVFLALCKKVSDSGMPEKPKEWLYGTLRNLLNKTYRGVYSTRENETVFSDNEIELPYMFDAINSKENEMYLSELMRVFKDSFGEDENELIDLIYYKRFKYREIALMLDTTEGAIKQRHYRLIRKLRKLKEKFEK